MSNTEKPVNLDIPFQDAIRFLAKHEPKQKAALLNIE